MFTKIGIIGSGQMGRGIAQSCLQAGLEVMLTDLNQEVLDQAETFMIAQFDRMISKEKMTESDKQACLARLKKSPSYDHFKTCDLIIEAATENEQIKKNIFSKLLPYLSPKAVVASNTSSISITRLASVTDRPDRFIGIHFMNPVPVMKLVEVIKGIATSEETYEQTLAFIEKLGKTVALSEDFPAFIVNRVLMPMINEAIYTLYEGVGTIEAIDKGMKLGTNHPMGPLELADFIGLDTCLSIMQVLYEGLSDSKYRPCPLLVKYVEAGWLGRKTKKGFYDYQFEVPRPTR
jgi:3-hydroxybutyryl-CoA dehydrogenase